MDKQVIVTIGREFGSAGHEIGEELARRLGVKFYDRTIVEEMSKAMNLDEKELEKYDEKVRTPFFSRTVRGYSNSPADIVFELQSKFIREKADAGESFVLIGRCGKKSSRKATITYPSLSAVTRKRRLHVLWASITWIATKPSTR